MTVTEMLTDRYEERLAGVLSCYDQIVITGTLPGACYAAGMTSFLNTNGHDFSRHPPIMKVMTVSLSLDPSLVSGEGRFVSR